MLVVLAPRVHTGASPSPQVVRQPHAPSRAQFPPVGRRRRASARFEWCRLPGKRVRRGGTTAAALCELPDTAAPPQTCAKRLCSPRLARADSWRLRRVDARVYGRGSARRTPRLFVDSRRGCRLAVLYRRSNDQRSDPRDHVRSRTLAYAVRTCGLADVCRVRTMGWRSARAPHSRERSRCAHDAACAAPAAPPCMPHAPRVPLRATHCPTRPVLAASLSVRHLSHPD